MVPVIVPIVAVKSLAVVSGSSDVDVTVPDADTIDDVPAPIRLPADKVDAPIKVQNQLQKYAYNRSRRRTHGASVTHMPDFGKMVAAGNRSTSDPYDARWFDAVVSDPFGEARDRVRAQVLPHDTRSMLERMARRLGLTGRMNSTVDGVITEDVDGRDVQDEIDRGVSIGSPDDVRTEEES